MLSFAPVCASLVDALVDVVLVVVDVLVPVDDVSSLVGWSGRLGLSGSHQPWSLSHSGLSGFCGGFGG